jgi:methionyl-tRNA formyltransferase
MIAAGAEPCAVFGYPPTPSEVEVALPVSELAKRHGIPYYDEPDLRKKPAKDLLRSLAPDVMLAVKWRRLFDAEGLGIPKHGTFVIHDSLLPHLRGAAPLNWALILGAGPIAAQLEIPVDPDDTAQLLEDKMVPVYADLAERLVRGLAAGDLPLAPQDESKATFGTWRVPEDGRLDWTWSAKRVHDFVRALAPPWPGAATSVDGRACHIARTRLLAEQDRWVGRVVGRVVEIQRGRGVAVLAGTGTVLVEQLLIDGKAVRADEVVKSVKATFGR